MDILNRGILIEAGGKCILNKFNMINGLKHGPYLGAFSAMRKSMTFPLLQRTAFLIKCFHGKAVLIFFCQKPVFSMSLSSPAVITA